MTVRTEYVGDLSPEYVTACGGHPIDLRKSVDDIGNRHRVHTVLLLSDRPMKIASFNTRFGVPEGSVVFDPTYTQFTGTEWAYDDCFDERASMNVEIDDELAFE